jgi:hypothetical protein
MTLTVEEYVEDGESPELLSYQTLEAMREKIHRLDERHIPDAQLKLLECIPALWAARRLLESSLQLSQRSSERAMLTMGQIEYFATLRSNQPRRFGQCEGSKTISISQRLCELTGCPVTAQDRRVHDHTLYAAAEAYYSAFGASNKEFCVQLNISASKAAAMQFHAMLEYERNLTFHTEIMAIPGNQVPEDWPKILLEAVDEIVTLMRDFEAARRRIAFDGASKVFARAHSQFIAAKVCNRTLDVDLMKESNAFQQRSFMIDVLGRLDERIHVRRVLPDHAGSEDVRLALVGFWRCICQALIHSPSHEHDVNPCLEAVWSRVRLIFRHLTRCESKPPPVSIARTLKTIARFIKDNLSVPQQFE